MSGTWERLDPNGKRKSVFSVESLVVDTDSVIHSVKTVGFANSVIPVGGWGSSDDRAMSIVPRHVRGVSVEGIVSDQAGGEAACGGRVLVYQNGRAVGLAYRKVESGGDRDPGLRGGRVELRLEPGGEGPASGGGVVLGEGELIPRFAQFDRLVGLQIA